MTVPELPGPQTSDNSCASSPNSQSIEKGWLPQLFLWNAGLGAAIGGCVTMVFWIVTWIAKVPANFGDLIILLVNLILASFTVVTVLGRTEESHANRSRLLAGIAALLAIVLGYAYWAHRVIGFLEFPHDPERDLALEQFKKMGFSNWFPTIVGMAAFGFYFAMEQMKVSANHVSSVGNSTHENKSKEQIISDPIIANTNPPILESYNPNNQVSVNPPPPLPAHVDIVIPETIEHDD